MYGGQKRFTVRTMMLTGAFIVTSLFFGHPSIAKANRSNKIVAAQDGGRPSSCVSPDGQYIAKVVRTNYNVSILSVLRNGTGGRRRTKQAPILRNIENVTSYIWVPKHPHMLVFATGGSLIMTRLVLWSGEYAKGTLSYWNGASHITNLYPVKEPKNELFGIYGVSADGENLVYSRAIYSFKKSDDESVDNVYSQLKTRRYLKLPSN